MFHIRFRSGKTLCLYLVLAFSVESVSCRHSVIVPAPVNTNSNLVTLPEGSVLAIRMAETIDSKRPKLNRAYAAVVSRDMTGAETQTLLPSGSPVTLVLLSPGGTTGDGSWQLGLSSAMIGGNSFLVRNGGKTAMDQPASMSQDSAALLGRFLGGVPGPFYPNVPAIALQDPSNLTVSGALIEISAGSLLTYRLAQAIVLVGSH